MSENPALNKALLILGRRNYSITALTKKLEQAEFSEENIAQAIERLLELRYLDDSRYASVFVNRYSNKGNYFIKNKLIEKGISKEIFLPLLDSLTPENERATHLVKRKAMKYVNTTNGVKKIAQFLANRGFSPQVCWQVAKATKAE